MCHSGMNGSKEQITGWTDENLVLAPQTRRSLRSGRVSIVYRTQTQFIQQSGLHFIHRSHRSASFTSPHILLLTDPTGLPRSPVHTSYCSRICLLQLFPVPPSFTPLAALQRQCRWSLLFKQEYHYHKQNIYANHWVIWINVSQPPGRGPVPGPGINYTGPWEAWGNYIMLQDLIGPVDN